MTLAINRQLSPMKTRRSLEKERQLSLEAPMNEIDSLLMRYPDLEACSAQIEQAVRILITTYKEEKKVLTCGNGGSAADAEHIVGELMKGYLLKRPLARGMKEKFNRAYPDEGAFLAEHLQGTLPAISLVNQAALLTAIANDTSPEMVFAQQVYGYGRPGDTLIALTTSGHSGNVIRAVQVAAAVGMHTIVLTGQGGGAVKEYSEVCIRVPGESTSSIQERHLPIYHALCAEVEKTFFS
jgi:D-sedoheptulose 7-phosphate isomerase